MLSCRLFQISFVDAYYDLSVLTQIVNVIEEQRLAAAPPSDAPPKAKEEAPKKKSK